MTDPEVRFERSGMPSSRYTQFVGTNYAPTEDERSEIEHILDAPERTLQALNAQLARLRSQRDELVGFITGHRTLLSPFRRVPVDVWREIFIHAVPILPCRSVTEAPLLLTTVCRAWREIAMSTPRLWDRIHIYLPRFHPNGGVCELVQTRKENVRRWLARSGGLPITISISVGRTKSGMEEDPAITNFMGLLKEFSTRLRVVKLLPDVKSSRRPNVWNPLAELTPEDLPMLREVHCAANLFTYGMVVEPTKLGMLLPRLKALTALSITGEAIPGILDLDLSWEGLTRLEINTDHTFSDPGHLVATLVKRCPKLTSLSLNIAFDDLPIRTVTPLPHPAPQKTNLKKVEITLHAGVISPTVNTADLVHRTLAGAFSKLIANNLEEVSMNAVYSFPSLPPPTALPQVVPFHEMVVQSEYPPIKHISIDELALEYTAALEKSLRVLPELRSIEFRCHPNVYGPGDRNGMKVGELMKVLRADKTVCPKLERVRIDCSEHISCDSEGRGTKSTEWVEEILEFVRERPGVNNLDMDFGMVFKGTRAESKMAGEEVRKRLDELRQKGVKVDWKWRENNFDYSSYDRPCGGLPEAVKCGVSSEGQPRSL